MVGTSQLLKGAKLEMVINQTKIMVIIIIIRIKI